MSNKNFIFFIILYLPVGMQSQNQDLALLTRQPVEQHLLLTYAQSLFESVRMPASTVTRHP